MTISFEFYLFYLILRVCFNVMTAHERETRALKAGLRCRWAGSAARQMSPTENLSGVRGIPLLAAEGGIFLTREPLRVQTRCLQPSSKHFPMIGGPPPA